MDKSNKIKAIVKAIGYAENGGKPDLNKLQKGKSGEMKSIFQFTPSTWKLYAKQVFGKEDVPLNNDTETYVVHEKVKKWVDAGYNTEQIASMWNAGEARPNAYKENWKGTNKYGVKYDTPAYAKKVASYATSFEKGDQSKFTKSNSSLDTIKKLISVAGGKIPEKSPVIQTAKNPTNVGLMQKLVNSKPLI